MAAEGLMDRLEFLIEVRGYEKKALAKYLGVSPATISRTLNGERSLSSKNLHDLCLLAGVSRDYLIHGANLLPEELSDENAELLLQIYYHEDAEGRANILSFANSMEIRKTDPAILTKEVRRIYQLHDPDEDPAGEDAED